MNGQDDDSLALVGVILTGIIGLVIAGVIGLAVSKSRSHAPVKPADPVLAMVNSLVLGSSPPAAAMPAPATVATSAGSAAPASAAAPGNPLANAAANVAAAKLAADAPSVRIERGVVMFYFASAKADLAAGASDALVDVVKAVKGGKKAVISGFHDASGNAAKNAELAKKRAFAVRDALLALGAPEGSLELKKPAQTKLLDQPAEARRVEVAVQ